MSLAILFHFLCAQHVSDINISIIRTLRLFCWITTLVVLFLVWCMLEFRCGWVGVVSMLQAEAQLVVLQPATWIPLQPNRTETPTHIKQEQWSTTSCASAWNTDTTPTQPHRNSNTHQTRTMKHYKLCFSLEHRYHFNPTTPKLQHTSNQKQYDQCGNSTE